MVQRASCQGSPKTVVAHVESDLGRQRRDGLADRLWHHGGVCRMTI